MTIPLTWFTFKIVGGILFLASVIALAIGSWPDNENRPIGDAFRWVLWPLFLIWLVIFIIRGFFV